MYPCVQTLRVVGVPASGPQVAVTLKTDGTALSLILIERSQILKVEVVQIDSRQIGLLPTRLLSISPPIHATADGDEQTNACWYGEEDDDEDGGQAQLVIVAARLRVRPLGGAERVLIGIIEYFRVTACLGTVTGEKASHCSIGGSVSAAHSQRGLTNLAVG